MWLWWVCGRWTLQCELRRGSTERFELWALRRCFAGAVLLDEVHWQELCGADTLAKVQRRVQFEVPFAPALQIRDTRRGHDLVRAQALPNATGGDFSQPALPLFFDDHHAST